MSEQEQHLDSYTLVMLQADKKFAIFDDTVPNGLAAFNRLKCRIWQGNIVAVKVVRKIRDPWFSQGPECPLCGIRGVHGCIGRRLPKPTPEDERRMHTTLNGIFGIRRPSPSGDSRQRTLDRIKQFQDASAEVERVCKENGWDVPVMTMDSLNVKP